MKKDVEKAYTNKSNKHVSLSCAVSFSVEAVGICAGRSQATRLLV